MTAQEVFDQIHNPPMTSDEEKLFEYWHTHSRSPSSLREAFKGGLRAKFNPVVWWEEENEDARPD